jgi:WD40 repeat protein
MDATIHSNSRRITCLFLCACALFTTVAPAHGQTRIPPGVVARLNGGSNPFLVLAYSPDSKLLASGGYEKSIHIWNPTDGKEIRHWRTPAGNISALAFTPDGKLLATGGVDDDVVHLWDVASGREVHSLHGLPRGTGSLSFAPDGKILAAGGFRTDEIYLWEVASGRALPQLSAPAATDTKIDPQFSATPMSEYSYVAFAPDGKTLASGHRMGLIRTWDSSSWKEKKHFRGPLADSFVHLTYPSDSRLLVSWGEEIRLWDVGSAKQLRHFGAQSGMRIVAFAISPDGRLAASDSSGMDGGDNVVHLWEWATGRERFGLTGHKYPISALAFAPDGRTLASGSRDGMALVWDLHMLPAGEITPGELSRQRLDELWQELSLDDAPITANAIRQLTAHPAQTTELLKSRLNPLLQAEPQQIYKWLAALDSKRFQEREDAAAELEMQVELAAPVLRQALQAGVSPETQRRLEKILIRHEEALFSSRQLQIWRALEVLEVIGTQASQRVLESIGGGKAEFRITREARATLERLNKRTKSPPDADSGR